MTPNRTDVKIYAQLEDWGRYIGLAITATTDDGRRAMVKTVGFEPVEDAEYNGPSMLITMETAQHLMDGLWKCGLRPTEGAGSAGALAATQSHLSDMQNIAFKLLDRELKP